MTLDCVLCEINVPERHPYARKYLGVGGNSMSKISIFFLCVGLLFSTSLFAQEKFVVLVPGFFNIPGGNVAGGFHSFSTAILESIQSQGYTPVVIQNLDPIGSVHDNGEQVKKDFLALASRYPGASFTVIAHSAGGLYVAHALTERPDLPIETVVTISTPYRGSALIELLKWIPGWKTITSTLNLASLREFDPAQMNTVLSRLRIPNHIRWVALAAAQSTCLLLSCAEAQRQSWLLSTAWTFSKEPGDGAVSNDSAIAKDVVITSYDGGEKKIETWADFIVPLEHWETVLDSNYFTLLGVLNPQWITQQQRRVFKAILERLDPKYSKRPSGS